MKNIVVVLFSFFFVSSNILAQTTHNVEVGGSMQVTPYFNPQYITIQQGDIVEWNCVQGTHNIDGQQSLFPNNPESFSYALNGASSPWDFSHTFNTPGVYDYECSMWNHNQTQFGTITVIANSTNVNEYMNSFFAFPNPAITQITFNKEGIKNIYNQLGELLISSRKKTIDITHLKVGIYILQCEEQRQKFIKQ